MILGNVLAPIFLTVCLFALVKGKIRFPNKVTGYVGQVFPVVVISALGICLMTISKVISYYSGFSGMTFQNLKDRFNSSYRGYLPEVILYAFLIPFIYFFVESGCTKLAKRLKI
jgi:hypothetical protein